MNNQFKYLIWSGQLVLLVLAVFLLVMTNHVSNTATNTNTVSFNGEGRVFAKPDIAVISFSILTEAVTSKTAQDDNSKKSEQIVKFLKDQKMEDKDIKTTGYNVYPQYSYPRPVPLGSNSINSPEYYPSNPKITGYQVNQSFQVKVRDLEKISTVLDGLVSAGANQVNNLGLQIDDIEEVRNDARELAINDAKEKANVLKKQIGIRLGKIVNFNEGGNYPYNDQFYLEARPQSGGGGIGGGGPDIPVGENEIIVNITITYQIK
jgi:uncharacterized protein